METLTESESIELRTFVIEEYLEIDRPICIHHVKANLPWMTDGKVSHLLSLRPKDRTVTVGFKDGIPFLAPKRKDLRRMLQSRCRQLEELKDQILLIGEGLCRIATQPQECRCNTCLEMEALTPPKWGPHEMN